MGPLGVPELIFIFILALLIFGPKRLPEIGRTIGKGMAEFRKASNEIKRTINTELALDEAQTAPPVKPWEPIAPPQMTAARSLEPPPEPVPESDSEPLAEAIEAIEAVEPETPEPTPEPIARIDQAPVTAESLEPR